MNRERIRALVSRALRAAAGGVATLGEGVELAEDALAKAREAVDRAGATGGDARVEAEYAGAEAKTARRAFAAWMGPTRSNVPTNPAYPLPLRTGVKDADAAKDAVLAACSAAGSYAVGHLADASRLAHNALRFATVASGGAVDWTVEE